MCRLHLVSNSLHCLFGQSTSIVILPLLVEEGTEARRGPFTKISQPGRMASTQCVPTHRREAESWGLAGSWEGGGHRLCRRGCLGRKSWCRVWPLGPPPGTPLVFKNPCLAPTTWTRPRNVLSERRQPPALGTACVNHQNRQI